ncbi:MAG TPA: hypothetical protein PKU78_05820, partial [Candidatus Dojkabacteria bacterium]|nr:hypothetical protein [Candidatus Dojkabacteria bacterium]
SGFDNKRKFDKVLGTTISLNNPAISFKVFTTCGGVIHLTRLAYSTKYLKGWNHIATKVSTIQGNTEISLYINGLKRDSIVLQGIHEIVYNTSSPFIIGGYSGRLGSRNTEKSIINNGYFKGRVSSIKLYDRVLSDFEIRALAMGMPGVYIPAISIPIKIPKMSGIEFIDGLHINRYRGFKSNIFDLKIKNFSDDPALQEVVKNYILSIIDDIKPANTTLHNIKFE